MPDKHETELTELLAQRLPQHPAPLALKRKLAAHWSDLTPARPAWWRRPIWVSAMVAALLLLIAVPVAYHRLVVAPTVLVAQAVDAHVHATRTPLGIEASDRHEVKPWFTGKLDFAPVITFTGDDEFPLRGGAIGAYGDRPAAVIRFARRKHAISLLVFRADGLPTPAGERVVLGRTRARLQTARGLDRKSTRLNSSHR